MKVTKAVRKKRIHNRIRKTISGTVSRPRLSVYRSNKQIYVQMIDDLKGNTLCSASSKDEGVDTSLPKIDQARQVGMLLAKKAVEKGIDTCLFDRSGYLYHGRVKALADGAREAGLKF